MKFNSNVITHPISSSILAALLLSSLSMTAFADNKAALKSAVGDDTNIVAENRTPAAIGAESPAKPADVTFKKLDMNQDGKLTSKEAVKDKTLSSNFDAVDVNRDGAISIDEYIAFSTSLPSTSSSN
ncbi:MAG: EF-hand domain-containing protein [Methylotenera sp.]|uniref:EF-hand domain-containing protein n=1 Tax=Methylotenera sp. TaxID=2051956 RepID=UPI002726DD9C|nr:EF-hand domain-containing protein [Methylotenera sp.]MDO9150763.1 EF-hand domain-containing protein [Methylotenera sp.]